MKYTNKHNLPDSFVRAVVNDTYTGPKADSKEISVTTLQNPPKIHFLKCRHWADLEEDVMDNVWRILGSAGHKVLERSETAGDLAEERLKKTIDGVTISGAFDLYDGKTQELHDYKFTSAYSVIYNPTGKPEWAAQMNIYAYLLEDAGFPVKGMKIITILRDHSKAKAKEGGNYPPAPVVVIDIPRWEKEQTEKYLADKIAAFKAAQNLPDEELPFCSSDDMWEKPATYAVMKPGRKTAVRVFTDEAEANTSCPSGCSVVVRPGTRNRCEEYCAVSKFCNQYKAYMEGK
jgi:hypothetical protein